MPQTNTYDPEIWLESTTRALKEYAEAGFNDAYEIVMEYPSTDEILQKMPLVKTIVHFGIDDIDERVLGFGGGLLHTYDNSTPGSEVVDTQEAAIHVINFDVGIWSSDRSGGTTSRMRAKQYLAILFQGKLAQDALDDAVNVGDGRIEILNFTGGRFLTDSINDVDVYRMVDGSLDVRVFSRTPAAVITESVEGIDQDENLDIDGVPIT